MSTHAARTFEVPAVLVAAGHEPLVDLDALDRAVEFCGEFGDWAEGVLVKENTKVLDDVCGDMRLLPRGVLSSVQLDDGSLLVEGLVSADGRVWDCEFNAWGAPSEPIDVIAGSVILDDDEVAYLIRALREGADEVWYRPYLPVAFISAAAAAAAPASEAPPTAQEIPAGSAIIAVVDPIDEDAVLEMLAITPGPHVLRRHDGQWFEDPEWVGVLKSVKPPKIVKLNEAQVASVSAQVDRSTNDQDYELFEADSREQYQIFTASAYLQELQNEGDETALFALVAVAGRKLTPKDAASTERLKRYWTVGKGAAKIRWGTPGSWRRCYRHLVKYVGPHVAPGLCTNLAKRLGGHGIATHVLSSADAVTAANPTGINGYDKGMSFEQSTDGVKRDYFGQFAPEGGSTRSQRRGDSVGKSSGTWDTSKARFKILPSEKSGKKAKAAERKAEAERKRAEAARKKAEAEKKRAIETAQREELARMSVEIAKLRAQDKDLEAAELRVKYCELALEYADTPTQKLNAQAALINAQDALRARKIAIARKRQREAEAAAKKRNSGPATSYPTGWSGPIVGERQTAEEIAAEQAERELAN